MREFSSNHLDFFGSASRERFSLLSEVVFEVGDNNEFAADVERLQASYLVADWLSLSAGGSTPRLAITTTRSSRLVFQLPVQRPLPVRFEDDGGVIPAHFVGVHLDGHLPLGRSFFLRYDVESANSPRAHSRRGGQCVRRAQCQAVNARLRVETALGTGTWCSAGTCSSTTFRRRRTTPSSMNESRIARRLTWRRGSP